MKITSVAVLFLLLSICTLAATRRPQNGRPRPPTKVTIEYADTDMLEFYQQFVQLLKKEGWDTLKTVKYNWKLAAKMLAAITVSIVKVKVCFDTPGPETLPCARREVREARLLFEAIKAAGQRRESGRR